jgi:hypothetical protein
MAVGYIVIDKYVWQRLTHRRSLVKNYRIDLLNLDTRGEFFDYFQQEYDKGSVVDSQEFDDDSSRNIVMVRTCCGRYLVV